jgi:hypothetical protein
MSERPPSLVDNAQANALGLSIPPLAHILPSSSDRDSMSMEPQIIYIASPGSEQADYPGKNGEPPVEAAMAIRPFSAELSAFPTPPAPTFIHAFRSYSPVGYDNIGGNTPRQAGSPSAKPIALPAVSSDISNPFL